MKAVTRPVKYSLSSLPGFTLVGISWGNVTALHKPARERPMWRLPSSDLMARKTELLGVKQVGAYGVAPWVKTKKNRQR